MFDRNTEMDMTEGPLFKKLVAYAIPIMLTGILQLLFNAADLIVVGRFARAYSSCGGWLYHLAHQSAGKCIYDDLHRRKRGGGAALRSA